MECKPRKSSCGTRNDLQELEANDIRRIRSSLDAGRSYELSVTDTVAAFDSFARQYLKQLAQRVPMTARRRNRFERILCRNLRPLADELRSAFDIDLFQGLQPPDVAVAVRMFHRRHVYEHNGGEADEKYIKDSGDTSMRPKQALHETRETASRIIELVVTMAQNFHNGFHQLFPPEEMPIQLHQDLRTRTSRARSERA